MTIPKSLVKLQAMRMDSNGRMLSDEELFRKLGGSFAPSLTDLVKHSLAYTGQISDECEKAKVQAKIKQRKNEYKFYERIINGSHNFDELLITGRAVLKGFYDSKDSRPKTDQEKIAALRRYLGKNAGYLGDLTAPLRDERKTLEYRYLLLKTTNIALEKIDFVAEGLNRLVEQECKALI